MYTIGKSLQNTLQKWYGLLCSDFLTQRFSFILKFNYLKNHKSEYSKLYHFEKYFVSSFWWSFLSFFILNQIPAPLHKKTWYHFFISTSSLIHFLVMKLSKLTYVRVTPYCFTQFTPYCFTQLTLIYLMGCKYFPKSLQWRHTIFLFYIKLRF